MALLLEIPLIPSSQILQCNILGSVYNLRVMWRDNVYVLDIADGDMNTLVTGLALVTGADLLAQFEYINFNFQMVIMSDVDPNLEPTYDTLGISSHLCILV